MMKPKQFALLALAALTWTPDARADADANAYFRTQFGLLVEYYQVELTTLPPMLRAYQQAPDATGLLQRLHAMQVAGEARLVESSYLVTSRSQSKMRSVRELIYPTSYDHAQVPTQLTGPIDPRANIVAPSRPAGFDTRHVGNLLEFELDFPANGKSIGLKISSNLVRFAGFENWGDGDSLTQQPRFQRKHGSTKINLRPGGSELIGTFAASPDAPGKRVLGIVSLFKMATASRGEFEEFKKAPPTPEEIKARHLQEPGVNPFDGEIDPNPKPAKQVSIISEYIEIDAALASQLVRKLDTISDATAIRASLDAAIAERKAIVLDANSVLTPAGQRMRSESIREVIYPQVYNQPGAVAPTTRRGLRMPNPLTGPITGAINVTSPNQPTSFDTRSTGVQFEFEPMVSEHGLIEFQLQATNDRLAGEQSYGEGSNADQRPVFESMKIDTNVLVPDGTSVLVAMHSLETARAGAMGTKEEQESVRNRRVLVFLTAKIKPLE